MESYITAHDSPVHPQSQVAGLFTQPGHGSFLHKDGIEQRMEVQEEVFSRSAPHFPLVNELNHIGATPISKAMMQGIDETLAKAFEIGFRAANTGMESPFFAF